LPECGFSEISEFLVMSTKSNSKIFSAKVGSSDKSKGASLPTRLNDEGVENAVKGRDERQQRAPLTAFPTRRPRLHFFSLTWAVVAIDRMRNHRDARRRLHLGGLGNTRDWRQRDQGMHMVFNSADCQRAYAVVSGNSG